MGATEMRAAAGAAGDDREGVRGLAAQQPPPRAAGRPRDRRRAGEPAEAEKEFRRRNEQVKAEYVVVDRRQRRGRPPPTTRCKRALRGRARTTTSSPSGACSPTCWWTRPSLASRVTVTDRELRAVLRGAPGRVHSRTEEAVRQPHPGQGQGDARTRGGPSGRRGAADSRRPRWTRSRRGADFADRGEEDLGGPGLAPRRAATSAASPRGRMVPEFDNAAFCPGAGRDLGPGEDQLRVPRHPAPSRARTSPSRLRPGEGADPADPPRRSGRGPWSRRRRSAMADGAPRAAAAWRTRPGSRASRVQKSAPLARGEVPPPLASPALVARAFELKQGEAEPEPFPVATGYAFIAVARDPAPPRRPS